MKPDFEDAAGVVFGILVFIAGSAFAAGPGGAAAASGLSILLLALAVDLRKNINRRD